jgi:Protein of unknown function (DUF998)
VNGTVRFGALAGASAPLLYLAVTVAISWLEEDFMEELGWEWPSGLSLGPHGWLQITNFLVFGLLTLAFALAVHRDARNIWLRAAAGLFALTGVGRLLLAFNLDPAGADTTWHGALHSGGYLLSVVSVLLGYVFFWLGIRRDPEWRETRLYSLWALIVFLPVFAVPDTEVIEDYVFLAVVFSPLAAFAARLFVARAADR